MVLTKLRWDFEIFDFRFLTIFFRKFKVTIAAYIKKSKTSIVWKTRDRRAKLSEIGTRG